MKTKCFMAALILLCGQPAFSATIVNSAGVEVCILPSGSAFVEWNARARVIGENPESVQSISVAGSLKTNFTSAQCSAFQGGTVDTCSRTYQQPGSAVIICGGELSTACGSAYFRASSTSTSTPAKPSNGTQLSGCKFADCSEEACSGTGFVRERGLIFCF